MLLFFTILLVFGRTTLSVSPVPLLHFLQHANLLSTQLKALESSHYLGSKLRQLSLLGSIAANIWHECFAFEPSLETSNMGLEGLPFESQLQGFLGLCFALA